jgi:hypothetical protein
MTKSSTTRKRGFENWPSSDVPPNGSENIIIAFHGLLGFAYNQQTHSCEIAIHGDAPDHDFRIDAYELEDFGLTSVPVHLYTFTPESHDHAGGLIDVEIENPETRGVSFFLPDIPQDLQWQDLVDVESSDFFDGQVEKKRRAQKPKIRIRDGLFCTFPTIEDFLRIEKGATGASAQQDLGKIAYVAVAVASQDSATSGIVTLTSDIGRVRLRRSPETTLLLFITNVCPQDECDEVVPDFELYYRMFRKPDDKPKYLLQKKPRMRKGTGQDLNPMSDMMSFLEVFFAHILSSQDAPCTEMGFGQSPQGTGEPPA